MSLVMGRLNERAKEMEGLYFLETSDGRSPSCFSYLNHLGNPSSRETVVPLQFYLRRRQPPLVPVQFKRHLCVGGRRHYIGWSNLLEHGLEGDDLVEIYELRGQLSKEFKIKDLGRLKYFWKINFGEARKQLVVARSSAEVEFKAMTALVQMRNWFLRFPTILQACESIIEMLRGQYAHSVGCFSEAAFHFIEAAKPKSRGGLGFGKISIRNVALLGKWLWRYPREGSALWHQVILSIYGSHSQWWDVNNIVRWSHRCPWKAIALVYQEFSKFTRFVVGNGDRIRFWDDLWWGEQPLGVQYPRLLRVVTDKNAPISSILGSTRPFSWNFTFRRNLSDSEIEDLEGLMQSFDRLHISSSVPDKRSWSLSSSGLFTVKSFFLALSQYSVSPPIFPTKFVWNAQVPFKVKSFVWLVAHKKVNTNDLLQLRRPYKALSPDICKLCMKHGETVDHLFLHCSLTIGLWHRLFQSAKMDWVSPRSISDMLASNFNGFGFSKRGIVLWQNAVASH
ncbi:Sister chromatid cohesion protein SCC4 [Vitis vinifera]|uniref:Sister chromatid cohesion protein SCC4 n=1 Tax=Vitis vinifera TaxID=29760 RepID=A0A438KP55_VITVI|nr:Sister chromatid cohesion protein SCC4 [Vitis vinifera]